MAKLPTVLAFGARPRLPAGGNVVSFRADIAETAEARAFGQEAATYGEAGKIADAFAELFAKEDAEREGRNLDTEYINRVRAHMLGDGSDETPGYLNLRGENAISGREKHIAGLDEIHDTMLAKASSPRVRALIERVFQSRRATALRTSMTHFGRQRDVANLSSFEAHQAAILDEAAVLGAAGDIEGVAEKARLAGDMAEDFARKQGRDPAFAAEQATTKIHIAEIQRRADDDVTSARQYFDAFKDHIDGRRFNAIDRFLDQREKAELVEMGKDTRDAIFVLDAGKTPDGLADLQTRVAGTKLAEPLQNAIEDRSTVADFMRLPPIEQAAELRSQPDTASRRDVELNTRLGKAHRLVLSELKAGNGLALAEATDVIGPLAPFDLSDPGAMGKRAAQARLASEHFRVSISPLSPAEAETVIETLATAPADHARDLLIGLHAGLGRDGALAVVEQLSTKRPELALALVNVADNPELSREIILGGRLLKDNPDVKPSATDRREAIVNVFEGVFTPDTASALDPIMDAAMALYAARRIPGGDLTYDDVIFEKSLDDVTGGLVEFNGRKIITAKPGMDEDKFEDVVKSLKQVDLIVYGNGNPVFGDGSGFNVMMFEKRFFGAEAQLVTSGFGTYLVMFPGLGFVQTQHGGKFEIDLRAFIDRDPPAPG